MGVGRPEGSYKYIHPTTKKPINAVDYHKVVKQLEKIKNVELETNKLKVVEQFNSKSERTVDVLINLRMILNEMIREELKINL